MAKFYLIARGHEGDLSIPRAIDEDTREKGKGKFDRRFVEWFKAHPAKPFRAPSFERKNDVRVLEFFSWQPESGVIRRHKFAFASDNRLLSREDEAIGTRFERRKGGDGIRVRWASLSPVVR